MAQPSNTPTDENTTNTPSWTTGDRLRKARRHSGKEAKELAADIGVSPNTISNYENDRVVPDRRTLISWAFATGVPLTWLEHGDEAPEESTTPEGRPSRRAGGGSLRGSRISSWSRHPQGDGGQVVHLRGTPHGWAPAEKQVPVHGVASSRATATTSRNVLSAAR